MSVKIRLQRKGRKKRPFYHIVVADARSPRDGRFIERLGTYNPLTVPATIELDRDRAYDWVMKGAQPTDTVRAILRFKGVYYRKHLMRGVLKGALTQEEADKKYNDWLNAKETKIADRAAKTAEEQAAFHARVAGANITAPPAKAVEVATIETPTEAEAPELPTDAEMTTEVAEEVVAVATEEPATEEKAE